MILKQSQLKGGIYVILGLTGTMAQRRPWGVLKDKYIFVHHVFVCPPVLGGLVGFFLSYISFNSNFLVVASA